MSSRNAQLGDAVVTALNAGTAQAAFSLGFTAVRRPVPLTDLTKLTKLTVSVITGGDASERIGRDVDDHALTILIGIEKKVVAADVSSPDANAEVDQLMQLVEQIDDFFDPETVSQNIGQFDNSTIRTLSDVNSLLTQNVFRGVVAVTFRLGV